MAFLLLLLSVIIVDVVLSIIFILPVSMSSSKSSRVQSIIPNHPFRKNLFYAFYYVTVFDNFLEHFDVLLSILLSFTISADVNLSFPFHHISFIKVHI